MVYPFQNPNLPIEQRIDNLITLLTTEEKISFLYDLSPGIPRLGIKKYYHGNECLHGVVRPGRATVFPQAIGFAATWDPDLIFQVATAISDEARAKYHAVEDYPGTYNGLLTFWSPNVNVAIDPRWGRTPETYGEDPYLTGRIGVQFVKGLQGDHPKYLKVVSTPKHYVANNEEHNRFKLKPKIREKWLRDYFLPGFRPLIMEGQSASIMGAYNAVFDIPCCHSNWLLTDVLRKEWGFNGYVVTDCGAVAHALPYAHNYVLTPTQAAASSINAGVDLECGPIFHKGWLLKAVKKGLVTLERLDFATRNVLRARFRLGMFDPNEINPYTQIPFTVVGCEKHSNLALKTAEESIVLLKNASLDGKKILPLDRNMIKKIAVIGPNADIAQFGDYSGVPFNTPITPLMGLKTKLKDSQIHLTFVPWIPVSVSKKFMVIPSKNLRPKENCEKMYGLVREYYPKPDFQGKMTKFIDEIIDMNYRSETADPTISNAQTDKATFERLSEQFSVKWKGYLCPDISGWHEIMVNTGRSSIFKKATVQVGDSRIGSKINILLEAGRRYPIEIRFPRPRLGSRIQLQWKLPNFHSSEEQMNLDREITAAKESDLVLCYSGLGWGDEHEGIDRNDFNLSKEQQRLIQTVSAHNKNFVLILIAGSNLAINWENDHLPAILHAWYPGERGGDAIANVLFGDYNPGGRLPLTFYKGIDSLPPFNDYDMEKGKTYWFLNQTPLYPFGFGLSYTDFEYLGIKLNKQTLLNTDTLAAQIQLKNLGPYDGDEVVQLYLAYKDRDNLTPLKQLQAFKRVHIKREEIVTVELTVKIADLTFWDEKEKKYAIRSGQVQVQIGQSSQHICLTSMITIQ